MFGVLDFPSLLSHYGKHLKAELVWFIALATKTLELGQSIGLDTTSK